MVWVPNEAIMFTPHTYVYACGVKGTLVGDAGVANGVGEAAVGQQAPPTMDNSSDHGEQQAHSRRHGHQRRQEAEGKQGPCLVGRTHTHTHTHTVWMVYFIA